MKRWDPRKELGKKEQLLLKRLKRTRKLFAFLRLHRHEMFDESFQKELDSILFLELAFYFEDTLNLVAFPMKEWVDNEYYRGPFAQC